MVDIVQRSKDRNPWISPGVFGLKSFSSSRYGHTIPGVISWTAMDADICIRGRRYRMACLEGIHIPREWERPIDGERLALLLGLGMGRVFDRPVERCRKYVRKE